MRRPGWAGWLVGHVRAAQLHGRHAQRAPARTLAAGAGRRAGDRGLRRAGRRSCRWRERRRRSLPAPRAVVPVGLVARGAHSAGAIEIAAAARSWERLPAPVQVSWFPARPYAQMLAQPRPTAPLAPAAAAHADLLVADPATCSGPLARGSLRPRRAAGGRWTRTRWPSSRADYGFGLGQRACASCCRRPSTSPGRAAPRSRARSSGRSRRARPLRLQQLLAELGYLPLDLAAERGARRRPRSAPSSRPRSRRRPGGSRGATRTPPPSCASCGASGRPNEITRGAVMMFEEHPRPGRRRLYRAAGLAGAYRRRGRRQGAAPAATATSTFIAPCRSRSTSGTTDA